ncbi:MAG: response regulator, partial [Candidatus Riflebacteria bacterium]|nr:response regulator [Candidatus Riflebacteria bacterium]
NMLALPDKKAVECIGSVLKGRNGYYEGYYSSTTANKISPIKVLATPIITTDSKIAGGIAIFEDISEHRVTQDRLQYQFQLERLVSNIAQSLVSVPLNKMDQVIENALCLSGRFFDADRGYVFQVDPEGQTITNTHEWCEDGIKSVKHKYQCLPISQLPGVLDFAEHSVEYLHFTDIANMPAEMADFKKILIDDEVSSILLLPLIMQGKFIGLFGYDCVKSNRSWAYEEISLLKIISEMFSSALTKKTTEKQLRESENRYKLVAENVNDIIWILDLETFKYTFISPAATRILGYTPDEMMQSEFTANLTAESAKRMYEFTHVRLDNLRHNRQTSYIDEIDQICKDGRIIQTEILTNLIFNPVTQHAEVIGITRNITERKEVEEHKRQLEIHRQQSLKADSLGRMAGAIAHHFNNQLQVVLGNLELLARNKQSDDKSLRSINDAMRATHKAADMSTLMLSYLGQQQVESQDLKLYEICRAQLNTLNEHLPSRHQLELIKPNTDVTINANQNRLAQVIKNLVINASESYGDNSGKIAISIFTVKSSEIPHSHRFPVAWTPDHDLYGCLKVQDNGDGIAEDDIGKIFDPFFTTKFAGRGLGLANALGCMRSIGGGITVNSQQKQGSSFCFYFPCGESLPETQKSLTKNSRMQSECNMILVVEDEEMVRYITRSLLENFNYKVIEACSGEKAIEVFKALRGQIDLVICDLVMPGIDGWQTLDELRKISPDLPVILASGYDQSYVMKGEHSQQPQAYLSKPFNSSSLQEAIKQALTR